MKFHWGTGIFLFLLLFLLAAGLFIAFAMRQEVSLVHKDYYEKGVDYSEQMDSRSRSAEYQDAIHTRVEEQGVLIWVDEALSRSMESARYKLYRPSDSRLDLEGTFRVENLPLRIPAELLSSGRYQLTVYWFRDGLSYEVEQTIFVP